MKVSMATNITSSQASAAVSAVLFSNATEGLPSPISSGQPSTSHAVNGREIQPSTSIQESQVRPSRTEELILTELQKLSARMSNMEQELQADTVTSTPRKKRKSKARNRKGEESVVRATINLTDTQTTFNDTATSALHHSHVSIPVHTQHSTSTTAVTTTSLFSQRNPIAIQQGRVPLTSAQTQVVFSTCQSLHPGQHRPMGMTNMVTMGSGSSMGIQTSACGQQSSAMLNSNCQSVPMLIQSTQGPRVPTEGTAVRTECTLGSQIVNNIPLQNTIPQCNANYIASGVNTDSSTLRGLSHGQEQIQQQQWGVTGGLPTGQQTQELNIIPSIQALKSTAVNQELVQRRLQELQQQVIPQDTGKMTNFSASNQVNSLNNNSKKGKKDKVEVVWPQDCAFVGHLRARVTYEQLTQSQFVLGFLRSVQEEVNPYIRSNMVEYLTELFQNVCDFGWPAAKGAHLVVMSKMEDGLVTWADLKKVNKIRKTYVRTSGSSNNFTGEAYSQVSKKGSRKPSTMPCKEFQEGKCNKHQDHEVGLITHKHICAYCLYTLNRMYNHAENVCNNKRRSKNGQQTHPQQ